MIRKLVRCVTAADVFDVQSLTSEQFSLIVLCHTLDPSNYDSCLTFVRERWGDAPIVRISGGVLKHVDRPEPMISAQPEALLEAVETLLASPA